MVNATTELLPITATPRIISEHAGVRYILDGAVRVTDEHGVLALADDAPAREIVGAVECQGAWVFLTADGVALASATFLGPLRRIEGPAGVDPSRGVLRYQPGSRGRLAVLAPGGALWTTDGASALAPVRALHAPVVRAVFTSAARGVALLDGGALARTDDGGTTWQPVPADAEPALDLWSEQGALRVRTTAGVRAFTDALALEAPSAAAASRGDTELAASRDLEARLREALVRRRPETLRGDDAGARGPGNTFWVNNGREVRVYDLATGRRVPRRLDRALRGCVLSEWGAALAARCYDGALLRSDDGERFARVGEGVDPAEDVLYSDDGASAALRGACARGDHGARDPDERAETSSSVCVRQGSSARWVTRALDAPGAAPVAMHGEQVLLSFARPVMETDTGAPRLAVFDAAAGTVAPLAVDAGGEPLRDLMRSYAWTADDTIVGFLPDATADNESRLLIGSPAGPLRAHALPAGVRAVAFIDRLRGVAVGDTVAALYRTLDGALTWESLAAPVDGDASALALRDAAHGDADVPVRLRCDAAGCLVGTSVVLRGWGPQSAPPRRALAALATERASSRGSAHVLPLRGEERAALRVRGGYFDCRIPTPARGASAARAGHAPDAAGLGYTATARVQVRERPAPEDQLELAVAWQGRDAAGSYRVRAAPSRIVPDAGEAGDARPTYRLLEATRRGALLERCRSANDVTCQRLWATRRGVSAPIQVVALEQGPRVLPFGRAQLTDDGGVLAWYALEPGAAGSRGAHALPAPPASRASLRVTDDPLAGPAHLVVLYGPDGRVRARRALFADAVAADVLGASLDGAAGLALGARDDAGPAYEFYPLTSAPVIAPAARFELGASPVGLCAGPAPAGALVLRGTQRNGFGLRVPDDPRLDLQARFELSAQGVACVRALERPAASASRAWSASVAPGGPEVLVGSAYDGATRRPLRCDRVHLE